MWCQRCGNKEKELFIIKDGKWICRKCLMFKEDKQEKNYYHGNGNFSLNYQLTSLQNKASEFILNEIINGRDCILSAVTGAGKTEIIYKLISYCIDNKLKIGIVIPRKDVVIELTKRISKDFKFASIVSVYGGHNHQLYADIIILTSHQLYRYDKYFDVVVIDEVDAFPFINNEMLNNFLLRSVKGNIVYMSATINKELLNSDKNVFYLNQRYHQEKLDLPKLKYFCFKRVILNFLRKNKGINIVYFPTIKLQIQFSKKLKVSHYLLNSKVDNRESLLKKLANEENAVVLSTLVLERGVTFKNTNVIVYKADHPLFRYENLVQICGRVGRSYLYPHGKIIFLVNHKSKNIKRAIRFIKKCNE